MADSRINSARVRSDYVNKTINGDRYDTEDISKMELEYIRRHAPKPRRQRGDLAKGDVVVVLEGAYTARRALLLKQTKDYLAVVFLLSAEGTPVTMKIDERYLLKLNANVNLPFDIKLDESQLHESVRGERECVDTEASDASLTRSIMEAITKVDFMKSYLSEDFAVDHAVEFYSQRY